MIKDLEIGEIVKIQGREWLLIETKIGGCDKKRPDLTLLSTAIKGIYRKSYFRRLAKNQDVERGFNQDE